LGRSPCESGAWLPRILPERIPLLKDIALRWEHQLPEGAIPWLSVSEDCLDHGICASVCPTGALRRYEEPGLQGLQFDASECFACGACVVVCPERAMSLEARESAPESIERISRHELRACARCDDEFAARGDDELCPACRKDVALFKTGFQPGAIEP
jgi:ferredoxin